MRARNSVFTAGREIGETANAIEADSEHRGRRKKGRRVPPVSVTGRGALRASVQAAVRACDLGRGRGPRKKGGVAGRASRERGEEEGHQRAGLKPGKGKGKREEADRAQKVNREGCYFPFPFFLKPKPNPFSFLFSFSFLFTKEYFYKYFQTVISNFKILQL